MPHRRWALLRHLEAPRITEHDRFFAGALIFQIAIQEVVDCYGNAVAVFERDATPETGPKQDRVSFFAKKRPLVVSADRKAGFQEGFFIV